MGRVVSVNVGVLEQVEWSQHKRATAIDKRPVAGPVKVYVDRVGDDVHGAATLHGGPAQAVHAYAREDADFWAGELGREVGAGQLGENMTTIGVAVSEAVTGERWRVGSTLLEVTTPRIPCLTFTGFWSVPDLIERFGHARRPGAYLKVIELGEIAAGDQIVVLSRPDHGVTVADLLAARFGDHTKDAAIRAVELPEKWHRWQSALGAA